MRPRQRQPGQLHAARLARHYPRYAADCARAETEELLELAKSGIEQPSAMQRAALGA